MTDVPIFFQAFQIGRVVLGEDGVSGFRYDPRWLATRGAFPLSLTMPLREDDYPPDTISTWLINLLPEEEQLSAVSRSLGVSRADVVAILREIGGDTAGAISIEHPSVREDWSYEKLQDYYEASSEEEALGRHFEDLKRRPFLAGEDGIRLSLAGGQQKTALAVLDPDGRPKLGFPEVGDALSLTKDGAPSTLIIKPDNPTLPGIVENEAYCLNLANAIGIDAVDARIMKAGPGRTGLGVLRYDRRVQKTGIRRIHQEDLAQVNGLLPSRKYEAGTLPGLTLTQLLESRRHLAAAQGLDLVDQVAFNILVGNTDAHAKNYSFVFHNEKVWLAPLYDVSTVVTWDHINQKFAQKIAGRKRKPVDIAGRHWKEIATEAGFSGVALIERVQDLVDKMVAARVPTVAKVAAMEGASSDYVGHFAARIEEHALRIAGRLRE